MKTHIPACVALAVALIATSAHGQYAQQSQSVYQNPGVPSIQTSTMRAPGGYAPGVQNQAYPQPQMQNNYTSVVGDACGCGSDCGGRCGRRRGGPIRSNAGGRGCGIKAPACAVGAYDPCCPTKYVSIFGGAATFNDIGLDLELTDNSANTQDISAILEQNDGWTIGGALGRSIGKRLRGEVEFSYRNATLDQGEIVVNGATQANGDLDGQLNIYRSMTNLLFNLNPNGRFNAYFGGGAGVGFIDLDATEPATPITARLQTSTWVYQGIVGMSGKINSRAELFVDYRYFGTDKLKIEAASPIGSANLNVDITSNDIFVGIRINR